MYIAVLSHCECRIAGEPTHLQQSWRHPIILFWTLTDCILSVLLTISNIRNASLMEEEIVELFLSQLEPF